MKKPVKIYTNLELKTIARKFYNMRDLTKKYPGVAKALHRRKLIKKYTKHMRPLFRKHSIEGLIKIAKKYKTRTEFQRNDCGAHMSAFRRGILDSICSHMKKSVRYSNSDLIALARKYKYKGEFQRFHRSAYIIAYRRKILNKCFAHTKPFPFEKYTISDIHKVAKKHKYRTDFCHKDHNMYEVARRRKLLDTVCSHMVPSPSRSYSNLENDVLKFVKLFHPEAHKKTFYKIKITRRPYVKAFELDIYIPSLNKAIEFDGTFWHSIKGLVRGKRSWPISARKKYHSIKDDYFLHHLNIEILHIKEKFWLNDNSKAKKKIRKFISF